LFIALDGATPWKTYSIYYFRVISGSNTWKTTNDSGLFVISSNGNSYSTTTSSVIIPSETTVKISVKSHWTAYGWTLYAYQ